jgi:hypothetical protein
VGTVTQEEKEKFTEIKERLRVQLEYQLTNFRQDTQSSLLYSWDNNQRDSGGGGGVFFLYLSHLPIFLPYLSNFSPQMTTIEISQTPLSL